MESTYNNSNAASGKLVESLLGGTALNYVRHMACICRASAGVRKERKHFKMAELPRQNNLAGGQERNRLPRATRNGTWLTSVPHRLNGTELYWEEFRDNICLIYGLMPQDIPTTCDDCDKSFSIKHALSCPNGGLVVDQHDDAAKELVTLGDRALCP